MPTLYITREDGMLGKKGDALYWRAKREGHAQILPLNQIEDVVVIGQGAVTTQALHSLMDEDVPVHYIDSRGRYKGSLTSGRGRGYAIRRLQYGAADDSEASLSIAKNFVTGKLLGERRTLLRYFYRNKGIAHDLRETCSELADLSRAALRRDSVEDLRGIEGIGAVRYFSAFSCVLQSPWFFRERNRRPPRDPVNAMLSFGYTMLLSSVATAAVIVGLDPCVGFIHPEYRGRPSLALDMMEEFRSPVVDRMVISSCNQGLFKPEDFEPGEDGGVKMSGAARKLFLKLYSERLRASVTNDSTGQHSGYEDHIRSQSAMLIRHLRGQGEYLPFVSAN
ncbi:CRISPR-associated endonuclease Cas1 [Synergistales bacterium]|nr:CRISPR-associated endonuclease Cas1 [Synergistales bacterium]